MAMTLDEKEQLFILLHKYMEELIAKNDTMSLEVGLKAQFNHARCIARKLEAGIEGGGVRGLIYDDYDQCYECNENYDRLYMDENGELHCICDDCVVTSEEGDDI